jgi:hypothetical protein
MAMKIFLQPLLIAILSITIPIAGVGQQATMSVLIDGKKSPERTIHDSAAGISVKKSKYKNVSSITLVYKERNMEKIYKRSIDITNDSDKLLYHTRESKLKPGWFSMSIPMLRSIRAKEKTIKVYLLEDPANDMMALPSRRKLLAVLHFI